MLQPRPRLRWHAVWMALTAAACSYTQVTVRPAATPLALGTLALAPFANLTEVTEASRSVTDAVWTELSRMPALVVRDGRALGVATYTGAIERSRARDLGAMLGADAVLYGTVLEYEQVKASPRRSADLPAVAVHARIVSVRTGEVLWAVALNSNNARQLWSWAPATLERETQRLATVLVDTLVEGGTSTPPPMATAAPASDVMPAVVEEIAPAPPAAPTPEAGGGQP